MSDLTTTDGIVAMAAGGVALVALVLSVALAVKLRRLRADQRLVLGEHGESDVVAHAARLARDFAGLHEYVQDAAGRLHERMAEAERRLDGAIAFHALVRYDAYGEMSGRQSTSIALLDSSASGVVLSSIHHRDTARLYAKHVRDGEGELELSPEEAEAVRLALAGAPRSAPSGTRGGANG